MNFLFLFICFFFPNHYKMREFACKFSCRGRHDGLESSLDEENKGLQSGID